MKTVVLTRTYELGNAVFSKLEFNAPKFRLYVEHGPVYEHVPTGVIFFRDAIRAYAEALLQSDLNPGVLAQLDLADAMRVENAIVGFFTEATQLAFAPDTSSSGQASPPMQSNG